MLSEYSYTYINDYKQRTHIIKQLQCELYFYTFLDLSLRINYLLGGNIILFGWSVLSSPFWFACNTYYTCYYSTEKYDTN